ncbi:MAG TPA: carboxypeptidase-like regulatory domain-containing protein, partial [Chitinophagaceae bacterium]|nr:carboxypeptidase-like regulatory domain-containing protein [Chitinophagaceae bacterium]
MKQIFILFMLVGATVFSARAQQISLSGLVNDKQSGEPLPGATINITGQKGLHIVTGLNGAFLVRSLPAGDYKIKVFFVGYGDYETAFTAGGQKT